MASFDIPIIETERLVLRAWRLSDLDALADFMGDEKLSQYRGGAVELSKAKSSMAAFNGDWSLHGYGGLAVATQQSTDVPIGMTGLYHPPEFSEPELFYSLFEGAHGNGFAVEMCHAVISWVATSRASLGPLMSMIHPDNAPSRAVSERIGATLEAEVTWRGMPRLRYRHQAGAR
ncbi:MAG: GNAT family N-acetyltransferase [Pseudomonadota bacterium]